MSLGVVGSGLGIGLIVGAGLGQDSQGPKVYIASISSLLSARDQMRSDAIAPSRFPPATHSLVVLDLQR
jgi:hypothetical protein